MKKITILGSTGSIGTQTLEVARTNQDNGSGSWKEYYSVRAADSGVPPEACGCMG